MASGAAMVSKQNCLVQTTHDGRIYRHRGAPELCYWAGLGAGSQLIDRKLAIEMGIRPVLRSEDTALLFDLVRQGLPIFAGDPYHYLYRRGPAAEHNWSLAPEVVAEVMGLVPVDDGLTLSDFEP
jgi:hypothetical protein